jgi:hypothetical protein
MSLEMMYLAMYGLVLMTTILIQVLISASQHGLLTLLGNRENLSSVGGAERAGKTVQNSVVAMTLVAPAVLMLALANLSTPWNNPCNTTVSHRTYRICNLLYCWNNLPPRR